MAFWVAAEISPVRRLANADGKERNGFAPESANSRFVGGVRKGPNEGCDEPIV
jgi:hypothetical protein